MEKDYNINVSIYDAAGYAESFKSVRALCSFVESEERFWNEKLQSIGQARADQKYIGVGQFFAQFKNQLNAWSEAFESWGESTTNSQISSVIQNLNFSGRWLWSGHAFINNYLLCLKEHGETSAEAFIEYVVRKNTNNITHAEWFKGYMFGYEFINQKSDIVKRRSGEKISLDKLRDQYVTERNQLFEETDSLRKGIRTWDQANRKKYSRRFSAQRRLNKLVIKNNNSTFSDAMNKMETDLKSWEDKVVALETLYAEKLKLKKPAEYWAKAAKRYGLQGSLWAVAIIAAVVVGLIYFREFFISWLDGKHLPLQLNSLQGVVLFGSIAAVYAFLLKTLSRLTFSAFHLMRDAEEREQLTYLYLSLSNESVIDEKSRDIVLQALFSRTETGLLAQEHGPTMPGIDVFNKIKP